MQCLVFKLLLKLEDENADVKMFFFNANVLDDFVSDERSFY